MSGRIYGHGPVILLALYGIAAGRASAESIRRFAGEKLDDKSIEKLGFSGGKLPCARTIRRITQQSELDFSEAQELGEKLLHMDGKSSRSAKSPEEPAPHFISLIDGESGGLIGQETCQKGAGTEREAAKELLKKINVKGAPITADAGFAPGNLPAVIRDDGAHYVLRVKGNAKGPLDLMTLRLNQNGEKHADKATETIVTGGRVDERNMEILPTAHVEKMLPKGLADAVRFGRTAKKSAHKKTGKTSQAEQYFITSLPQGEAAAADLLRICREHWRVENNLHRPKDLYLGEDKCRCRSENAPAVRAALRSFAVGILKKIAPNICEAIDKCAANHLYFLKYVT